MVPAVVSISYINYAVVAVLGGIMALNGMTDIGSLASYLVFVRQAAMPINQFTQQSNFLLAAMAGAERIFEAMSLKPEVDEGRIRLVNVCEKDGKLAACAEKTGRWAWQKPDGALVPLRGDVRFRDVSFGYDKGHTILKHVSLYAKPGQKIAFVGSTGAGKTTITNLINRFYDIDEGSVTYDGIDVREIEKDSLRRSLGIVLQDTHLFTGTIADNIRFGKLDATMDEVIRAARDRQRRLLHPPPAPGVRHPHHLRRRQPEPGPAPAAGHRPRRRGRPAGADFGRGHQLHRYPYRGADRKGHGPADGGPHRVCHCPPAVHRAQRQRHHGIGARPGRRARRPRGLLAKGASIISCTTGCSSCPDAGCSPEYGRQSRRQIQKTAPEPCAPARSFAFWDGFGKKCRQPAG